MKIRWFNPVALRSGSDHGPQNSEQKTSGSASPRETTNCTHFPPYMWGKPVYPTRFPKQHKICILNNLFLLSMALVKDFECVYNTWTTNTNICSNIFGSVQWVRDWISRDELSNLQLSMFPLTAPKQQLANLE